MKLPVILWLLLQPLMSHAVGDPSSFFNTVEEIDREPYDAWLKEKASLYPRNTFLATTSDPNQGAAVFWKISSIDDPPIAVSKRRQDEEPRIQFAIAVRAAGWVGFGISQAGGMLGADVALFSAAEPTVLVDSYIVDTRVVQKDDCQNWNLVSTSTEGGWLIVEMSRLLDTGDPQDHRIINDGASFFAPTRLIAAWGDEESAGYHGPNRARNPVKLFADFTAGDRESLIAKLDLLSDGFFEIRETNFAIPQIETKYQTLCKSYSELLTEFSLPEGQTLTMIGVVAVITDDTAPFVHHFLVYQSFEDNCDDADGLIYGWAPGEEGLMLPENVGIPMFGEGNANSFRIEIHYNNPGLIPGQVDSSGIRIYYSLGRREHEAAFLLLGDPLTRLGGTQIGEGLTEFSLSCDGTCSALALLGDTVTVLEEYLHMHKSGTRMVNEVIRDNKVVHTGAVDVFEFEQQGSFRVQQESFQIKPGDAFRTTCYYRDGTEFGRSSQEEMCIAFLMYYPAKRLSFGQYNFPWSCAYGLGTSICDEELTQSIITNEEDLGRVFGTSRGDCTVKPQILPTNPTAVPVEEGPDTDGSSSSTFALSSAVVLFQYYFVFVL